MVVAADEFDPHEHAMEFLRGEERRRRRDSGENVHGEIVRLIPLIQDAVSPSIPSRLVDRIESEIAREGRTQDEQAEDLLQLLFENGLIDTTKLDGRSQAYVLDTWGASRAFGYLSLANRSSFGINPRESILDSKPFNTKDTYAPSFLAGLTLANRIHREHSEASRVLVYDLTPTTGWLEAVIAKTIESRVSLPIKKDPTDDTFYFTFRGQADAVCPNPSPHWAEDALQDFTRIRKGKTLLNDKEVYPEQEPTLNFIGEISWVDPDDSYDLGVLVHSDKAARAGPLGVKDACEQLRAAVGENAPTILLYNEKVI